MSAEPSLQELRELVAEFQPGKGHVLPALHKVQHHYGYIMRPAIEVIARQLNSTPALIYGALSFYSDFRTAPLGKQDVMWCSGPTCRLLGGDKIREAMQQVLQLPLGGRERRRLLRLPPRTMQRYLQRGAPSLAQRQGGRQPFRRLRHSPRAGSESRPMNVQLESILAKARQSWSDFQTNGKPKVRVTIDTSSNARGAQETLDAIRAEVARLHLDADIEISGSWGFNWMEPTVSVRTGAGTRTVLYANVTADRVREFLQRTLVEGGDVPELALGVVEGNPTADIALLSDHPFMAGQVRRLMANLGLTEPEDITGYIAHGGYEGFAKALDMTDEGDRKGDAGQRRRRSRRSEFPRRAEVGFPPCGDSPAQVSRLQRGRG